MSFAFTSWLKGMKSTFARMQRSRPRRAARSTRFNVESLEDRVTPATLGTYSVVEGPAAGNDSVVLAATGAWTAATNSTFVDSSFLHVTAGSTSGTGNAVVQYSFDANSGATRSGTLTIAGQTYTVTQAGSTYVAARPLTTLVSGLTRPPSVAVDAAGNVYIADYNNNAVKEWSATTQQVSTLVSAGLNSPEGVAVDAAGDVYIADTYNGAVKEWSATTHQVSTLVSAGLKSPQGVAVDAAGNVYVADVGNNAVKEWSATTQQVSTVSAGLFLPQGVAVDAAGNVYIADSADGMIDELTRAFVPTAVSVGPAAGSASLPVLPASQSLTGAFAPSSDQSWLAVGSSANGVVNLSVTQNSGPARTAHLTVLGQQITVNQAAVPVVTITGTTVPAGGTEGSPVALSATATDSGGYPLTYTWTVTPPPSIGSAFTLNGASASFTPADNGSYSVSLTVRDSFGSSRSVQSATGVISWLRGEGNANDAAGSNNGTLVGGVTYAPGIVGQAFNLKGGYVQLPANFLPYPTSGTSTTPQSFETWFNTTDIGGVILGQQDGAAFGPVGGFVPAVYVGTDRALHVEMFWGGSANQIVSATAVNDGQWHHVAVTYDGTVETVYLDGVAIGTKSFTQVAYAGSYQYQLGTGYTIGWKGGNGGWFTYIGLIDEPTFYSRALSAADVQSIVNAGSAGKLLPVAVANVAPTPGLSGYTTGLATQVLTFTATATDPSPVDRAAGFTYNINWGDGQTSSKYQASASNSFTHVYATAGTYTVTLTTTDKDGGAATITRTITVLPVTSANLQTVINEQAALAQPSLTFQETSNTLAQTLVGAVNGLAAETKPVTVTMQLGSGSFTDTSGAPHANITLVISGSGGSTTIVGHSPALQVSGGTVVIENLTLVTDTDAPTLVISGGNVTLRNVTIEESSTSDQAALLITGGTVDLGTAASPGGNTFDTHGRGELIHNSGPNAVSALGDTFEADGVPIASPYRIADRIFDALDECGGGLVTYVANNVYVTPKSGSIQRGVNAVAAGGTVNVEDGTDDDGHGEHDWYAPYNAGSKLLTVAFENGPVLTQEADALNPALRTLVVQGAPGDNQIRFAADDACGGVWVGVNDVAPGTFRPTGRLIAYGGAGDNDIRVSENISLPAWLYGGSGDNWLQGGGGNNVLVGGSGHNVLIGGQGRDLMIGGSGASWLEGRGGDDLMIGGTTAFDDNEVALAAIMAEWTSGRDYATRIADLSGTGSGPRNNGNYFLIASGPTATVFGASARDVLDGGPGMDWFFADLSQDVIHGRHGSEIVENL